MKKNEFKTFEYQNRYKTFHNAIRYINANVLDATNDVSPDERAIHESKFKYEELKRMANTRPIPRGGLIAKAFSMLKTYKEVFYSYLIFFGFVAYVIGLFMAIAYHF